MRTSRIMAAIAGAAAIAVVATASAARGATHAASSYSADVVAAVRAEADWTLGAQMSDGAIAHYTDRVAVWPYVANFAAAGLVRATTVTRDTRYVSAAWKWFGWYQSHETAEGFVTDYTISADGVETSTGDMDSTDAYAGTFLHAVWQAYSATGNRSAVKSLLPGIRGAVRAIEATLDTDGLTWAKPSYHVKYLMDECEVYAGLRAAAKLLSAVGDSAGSAKASTEAGRVQAGVDALWNPVLQSYDWAVHGNGVHQVTSWSNLYPDALEQMWVVGFGLAGSARATQLTATFAQTHPSWDKPAATDYTSGTLQPVEYWPVAGWAMDVAGRTEWAATAAANIRSAALSAARAWPYTPASAGQLTVLLSGGPALA